MQAGGSLARLPDWGLRSGAVAVQSKEPSSDGVDFLLRNELSHLEGSPSTRTREETGQQKVIHRLELWRARDEGNR